MINIFRKHQQGLMIVITILVIISFAWLYNSRTSMRAVTSSDDLIAMVYGRGLTKLEAQRLATKMDLAVDLGLFDLVQNLTGTSREQMYNDFVLNLIVLEHEAEANQVRPSEEEVVAEVKKLEPFQTQNQFDPQKYAIFVQEKLAPRGFTEVQLEEVVRADLKVRKLKALVGSTVAAAPSELRAAYDAQYQKSVLSLVRLDLAGFAAGIEISNDDARKAFDQRKDSLKTEETRKVKLVTISLPSGAGDKPLQGKERMEALKKAAETANDFTQAMLAPDANFDAVAAKFNLTVVQTGEFSQAKPDAKLAPSVVAEAFKITLKDPNSDAVQTENGYSILHLEKVIPARPLTFEEAAAPLKEALKNERAREALAIKSGEISKKIQDAVKAGKSFADAAKEAGLKAESFPEFSLAELGDLMKNPEAPSIIQKSLEMSVGQVSDLVPSAQGGVLVYVEKRIPVDEAKFNKDKAALQERFTTMKQNFAFREWLRIGRDAAKVEPVRS